MESASARCFHERVEPQRFKQLTDQPRRAARSLVRRDPGR
jgi:hypothetical protein